MSQRRFSYSGGAVEPVGIAPWCVILLQRLSHPAHDLIEDRLSGALHAAAVQVIAGLGRFETLKQKLLLYMERLRMKYRQVETMNIYRIPW